MGEAYWIDQADRQHENAYRIPAIDVTYKQKPVQPEDGTEYVQMQLPDGEPVRFKRMWSGYRFTDSDVARLMAGMEIRIQTNYSRGVIGSLEWQTFNSYDYYGFSQWSTHAYNRENAPFPLSWNNHTFTEDEEAALRAGHKVLLICPSKKFGTTYAVNVSFAIVTGLDGEDRWGISPHFEEFNLPATSFTRENCPFKPVFSDRILTQAEIAHVRSGGSIPYQGLSKKTGRPYNCHLVLILDKTNGERWRLVPMFS